MIQEVLSVMKSPIIVKNKRYGFYQFFNFTRLSSGKKGRKLLTSLQKKHSCIVNRHCPTHRERTAGYRFLNNTRVTEEDLIKALQYQCRQNCDGLHVIGIQDTTEYNYSRHKLRLKEDTLGVVGNNEDTGYFAHVMVAFDALRCLPQGISYCKMWSRPQQRTSLEQRRYKNLPIEDKESYRWLEAADQTKSLLKTARHFTFLSDRESDIYQLWDRVPDAKTDFIIRARGDRPVFDEEATIFEMLNQRPVEGSYTIELKEDKRAKRSKRTALIQVKYMEVAIKKPRATATKEVIKNHVVLRVVEAREMPGNNNPDEALVHWILFTTHAVNDFEQACRIINWYTFRWQIEQFFRLTKSKGIDLESSQLESGEGLKKLGLLGFASALRILQMSLARDGIVNDRVQKYFNPQEVKVLYLLDKELKGTTLKQQNPHRKDTLAWASWVIARLGGYSGYSSQSPPGPLTYKWGLQEFNLINQGFNLAGKDVYKE